MFVNAVDVYRKSQLQTNHLPLYNNSSQLRNSDLRWNRRPTSYTKFPVQIVLGVILGKPAELLHCNTRKKEHLRNTKVAAKGSRIANHPWSNNHAIDFENASIIDKGTFRTRKTLEASLSHHSFYPSKTAIRAVESS